MALRPPTPGPGRPSTSTLLSVPSLPPHRPTTALSEHTLHTGDRSDTPTPRLSEGELDDAFRMRSDLRAGAAGLHPPPSSPPPPKRVSTETVATRVAADEAAGAPATLAAAHIGGTAPNPEDTAPWWSFVALTWLNPFMKKASRSPVQFEDLFKLRAHFQAANVRKRVEEYLNRVDYASLGSDEESRQKAFARRLFRSTFYVFPRLSILSLVLHGLSSSANLSSQILLLVFLSFLKDPNPAYLGYLYCLALFVAQFSTALGWNLSQYIQRNIALSIKTAFISLTYNKAIRMSPMARQEYSNGRIMNLVASDCSNLENFFTYMNDIFIIPVEATAQSILLIVNMKASGAIGLAFMLLVIGVNAVFTRTALKYEQKALSATDHRVKLTSDILSGIKIIKFFAWEEALQKQINSLREKELLPQLSLRLINATFSTTITLTAVFTNVIIFGCYYALGNRMDSAIVFSTISILSQLRLQIALAPQVVSMYWSAKVSIQRLTAFLTVEDADSLPSIHPASDGGEFAVVISDGSFIWPEAPSTSHAEKRRGASDGTANHWRSKRRGKKGPTYPPRSAQLRRGDRSSSRQYESGASTVRAPSTISSYEKQPLFRNLELKVKKGSLTVVVGSVGAGKSSLLHSIIGDMKRLSGRVDINGRIALSTQSPWLQNATVKDNILFGRPYDEGFYKTVIQACSLTTDLMLLANGDMTEIGERGVTLSGGQAARVNLARAVYSDADIILLDDPLAAVDAHVGRAILEDCILGLCKDKTVVLVTHHVHVTSCADTVILVEHGEIVEEGTFTQLMNDGKNFASLMAEYGGSAKDSDGKTNSKLLERTEQGLPDTNGDDSNDAQKLLAEEERMSGGVSFKYYLAYFRKAGGMFLVSCLILLTMTWQAQKVLADLWLTFWVEYRFPRWSDKAYIIGLFLLAVLQAAVMVSGTFAFAFAGMRASRRMHAAALASVMNAPMSFFETNPLGRIISRFSKDLADTDRQLPRVLQTVLEQCLGILGTFVLIGYAVPWVLLLAIPLLPLFLFFLRLFRSTMRELKRVESIARSPLYSQISETLTGLSTIRAYDASDRFRMIQEQLQDIANQPTYIKNTVDSWMSIRAEGTMAIIIGSVATVGYATKVDSSFLGLAVGYALSLTIYINFMLREFADLESRMNCIERLHHYTAGIPQEAAAFADGSGYQGAEPAIRGNAQRSGHDERAPDNWPSKGAIRFDRLTLRYRPELPPVLQELSFSFNGGERVGVVGRTGAGKSSLIVALFRLVEFNKGVDEAAGTIWIDDVDISKLGLRELRRSISIIPQSPVLFDGTIRSNLDPTGSHTDGELWSVLERCALKDFISAQDGKLDALVTEEGDNLSVGQRQLLCLGRAMLRPNSILVIDEATASVDLETDHRIQKILREDFRGRTIVCIAHRLNTLVDYDRILVLDKGKVLEFDSPRALASQPTSAFSSLIDGTGPTNAAVLRGLIMASQ